ncbi:MAG TPA: ROK family protein [Solirubrobacterales bacterium]|nr:ROK family protein [Solirubrobacterales bacterium]
MSGEDGTPAGLRAHNRQRVLEVLLDRIEQGATQAELCSATGLSRPSVSSILKGFAAISRGREARNGDEGGAAGRGRTGASHGIDPLAAWAAAIDIGRNHVYVGVCDLRGAGGDILNRVEASPSFEIRRSPLLTLELAADTLNALLDETPQLLLDRLAGLVVSLPGPVANDRPRDRILDWGEHDIAKEIWQALRSSSPRWYEREASPHVLVDNDANLSAVAEHTWGVGRGTANAVYVKWSTGLGGGLILDGELRRGAGGAGGEFGHTPVPEDLAREVEECPVCGRRCFESAVGFRRLLAERRWSYQDVQKIAHDPTHSDHRFLADWIGPRAELLGLALVPIVNTVNPELLIVDGIVDRQMEPLFARQLLGSLERNGAMAAARSDLTVRGGKFTDSAAARGGLALAIHELAPGFLLELVK